MVAARSFVLFIFFSFCGWLWETLFCTIRSGSFQNRGFLFGPICPIYGTGMLAAQLLFTWAELLRPGTMPLLQVFLISTAGSALLEFSTSWYLERRFKARWWDYSHLPLNIQGRICIPISFVFGAVGVLAVRYVFPWATIVLNQLQPDGIELVALCCAGLLGADFALTEANLSTLLQHMNELEHEFTERGERAYQALANAPTELVVRAIETPAGDAVAKAVGGVMIGMAESGEKVRGFAADGSEKVRELAERSRRQQQESITRAVASLTWWQRYQLRRMTGFKPSSIGALLKNALMREKHHS